MVGDWGLPGGGESSDTGAVLCQSGIAQLGQGVAHGPKLLTPAPALPAGVLLRSPGRRPRARPLPVPAGYRPGRGSCGAAGSDLGGRLLRIGRAACRERVEISVVAVSL